MNQARPTPPASPDPSPAGPPPGPPAGAGRVDLPAPLAALAGAVAAGAALAVGELPSAVAGARSSLVTSVGNEVIDRFAASIKDLAVSLFGQNDKAALVVGIVATSLLLGAWLGVVGRRRRAVAVGGFVAFGAVGWGAMASDPGASTTVATVSAVLAVVAGVAVLGGLLTWLDGRLGRYLPGSTERRWTAADDPTERRWTAADDPTVRTPDRRTFLAATGAVGVTAALLGAGGRVLRGRSSVESERLALDLPRAEAPATAVPEGELVDVQGISPYLTPNHDFYRIDTALGTPQVSAEGWRLRFAGLVDQPYELSLDDLLAMDLVEEVVTIACVSNEVGGDLVGNARWLGVPLAGLLDRAGVQPDGTQIVGRSVDRFTVGFPTSVARDGRVAMVAVGMNGEPLPARHGYPARLVVAGLYGYVSATKWLTEIELTRFEDFDAYWVPRGWAKEAPVKTQSRIDVPRSGATVAAGTVPIGGVAWAPTVGIETVEVRVDDGPWVTAELGAVANADTWVQWVHRWDATPGRHTIAVRATDGTGAAQTDETRPPRPDGATGHHTVQVAVEP